MRQSAPTAKTDLSDMDVLCCCGLFVLYAYVYKCIEKLCCVLLNCNFSLSDICDNLVQHIESAQRYTNVCFYRCFVFVFACLDVRDKTSLCCFTAASQSPQKKCNLGHVHAHLCVFHHGINREHD